MGIRRYLVVLFLWTTFVNPASSQTSIQPVSTQVDRSNLVVESIPVDVPIPMAMDGEDHDHAAVFPPIVKFELPVDGYIYGFDYELLDESGETVPRELLHHFNVLDPTRREIFLPIARRVFAAGKETGPYKMPKTLLGIAFSAGDSLILSTMLHNPTTTAYEGVRLRLTINYVKRGLPWPLGRAVPFQMDTRFPTGDKSFDLPPGQTSASWEGRPITEGRILALGGHLHEFADRIYLQDVESGDTLWTGNPEYDESGNLQKITRGEFYGTIGILLKDGHSYRVTAEYDNPTADTIPDGGMGVVAGIFVPSDPDYGFHSDAADSLYQIDMTHFLRLDPEND